ncbi:hypothetical protein K1W54_19555 [Micromonospora sp. CPCC 205371]|nr:hypothetical protein [Micromonospora sp. CPCC 205371]
MEFGLNTNVVVIPTANSRPARPSRHHDRDGHHPHHQADEEKNLHMITPDRIVTGSGKPNPRRRSQPQHTVFGRGDPRKRPPERTGHHETTKPQPCEDDVAVFADADHAAGKIVSVRPDTRSARQLVVGLTIRQ